MKVQMASRTVIDQVVLTLSEQEARDLKVLVTYDCTIPAALRKAKAGAAHVASAERIITPLYNALDQAGV